MAGQLAISFTGESIVGEGRKYQFAKGESFIHSLLKEVAQGLALVGACRW